MLFKNVASQGVYLFLIDSSTGAGKTGDASNISVTISLDGGATSASSNSASEIGGGVYTLTLSQAETNADRVAIIPSSSTASVVCSPIIAYTTGGAVPAAAAGGNGGLPTVDASNHVAGVVATVSADVVSVSGDSAAADNLEADYDGTGYNKSASTIGTTTANTDMRGTDSALLAASAPSNFADLAITASAGKVTVGTNDDKTGYSVTGTVSADVVSLSGDSTAADNLEADYDGSGYNKSASTIGTVTTNTDMRGTDSAMLAASAPSNFADLEITASTGKVTVGTNDDKTGYSITGTVSADIVSVSGDSTAADNLEKDYDGTGYNKSASTIGTTTTNTDMRGTDSAILAASAPTNFGDLAITASTGRVTVGTNNDKAGYSISGTLQTLDELNNFDPAADTVANVTTAGTVTNGVTVSTVSDGAIGADAVADIWSTAALAESYASDGSTGTPAQLLYQIQQALTEFAISSTTVTVKKLDGSTTASTYTLDDASSPTSRTRAS